MLQSDEVQYILILKLFLSLLYLLRKLVVMILINITEHTLSCSLTDTYKHVRPGLAKQYLRINFLLIMAEYIVSVPSLYEEFTES